MATIQTLADTFDALTANVEKIGIEVQVLKDALVNTSIPANAQAAFDRLTASIKKVDDLNPDATTPPAP
jgi:hypothetical protein